MKEEPRVAVSRVARLTANWAKYWPFGAMYFVQGLQHGFVGAVVIRLIMGKEAQISQTALIASAMTWAWTAKAVFATVADRWELRRREILAGTTIASAAVLVAAAASGFAPTWMVGAAVLLGVLRCLQDVTVDGVAIATLQGTERATGNTVMSIANTIGGWVGGTWFLALKAEGASNLTLSLAVAGLILVVGLLGVRFGRVWHQAPAVAEQVAALGPDVVNDDTESSKAVWRELGRALKATPVAALVLAATAYLGGQGFTSAFVGQFLATLGFAPAEYALLDTVGRWLAIVGVVCGGMLFKRLPPRIVVAFAVLFAAGSYAALGVAGALGNHTDVIAFAGVSSFSDGMLTVVLTTVFMSLVNKRAAATQYALYAGFINLSIVIGPLLGGAVMERLSFYREGFYLAGVIALLPLFPLWWLKLPERKE